MRVWSWKVPEGQENRERCSLNKQKFVKITNATLQSKPKFNVNKIEVIMIEKCVNKW